MPTRPGYIWSGTEWVAIGQEAVLAPVSYQATAPTTPATGDIWIESDVDVPSIDSAQFLRWRKTMTGGETSLSGNDDSSLSLRYTPGYEQLYINGVLQVRGQDYTATTGTTVTGLTALVANDVVEIFSAVARTVADVYTQTQSDARFVNRNVGGLNLVVPASVSVGSGSFALSANGQVTFTGASSVSINGCFSSTYDNYQIILDGTCVADSGAYFFMRNAGTNNTSSYNIYSFQQTTSGAPAANANNTASGSQGHFGTLWTTQTNIKATFSNPFRAVPTHYQGVISGGSFQLHAGSTHGVSSSFDGFSFLCNAGNITGTIRIYGYNNGA